MGSTCSCLKSTKEPLSIQNKSQYPTPKSNLKLIYPSNMSIKDSKSFTKENFNIEDESLSVNTNNLKRNILENASFEIKGTTAKKKKETYKIKEKSDTLQIFNNFEDPMVKLLKIYSKNKNKREEVKSNSEYDNSFELDENRKCPIVLKYQEVAP